MNSKLEEPETKIFDEILENLAPKNYYRRQNQKFYIDYDPEADKLSEDY